MSLYEPYEPNISKFDHFKQIFHGHLSAGFGNWKGKPKFSAGWLYYDGYQYYLHVWRFWVCSSY